MDSEKEDEYDYIISIPDLDGYDAGDLTATGMELSVRHLRSVEALKAMLIHCFDLR